MSRPESRTDSAEGTALVAVLPTVITVLTSRTLTNRKEVIQCEAVVASWDGLKTSVYYTCRLIFYILFNEVFY